VKITYLDLKQRKTRCIGVIPCQKMTQNHPFLKAKRKKLSKRILGPAQRKERLFCSNILFEMLVFNSIVIRLLI
jgi:hypothetical protein